MAREVKLVDHRIPHDLELCAFIHDNALIIMDYRTGTHLIRIDDLNLTIYQYHTDRVPLILDIQEKMA